MDLRYLNHSLYLLHYIDDVTQFTGLNDRQIAAMSNREPDIVLNVREAIMWGVQHPEFDFLAFNGSLCHSNEDIYVFLCKVAKSLGLTWNAEQNPLLVLTAAPYTEPF